jgi:hypothetical protein
MSSSYMMSGLTRRGFVTAIAGLAASSGLLSTALANPEAQSTTAAPAATPIPANKEKEHAMQPSHRRIFVASEFAPLRTVVLAQSQMRLPDAETGSKEQLNDVTVEYVDFSISRSFGGAFRCSTQTLWRE